jgi:hypothetical protein
VVGTCGTSNLGSTTHVNWWWDLWSGLTPVAQVGAPMHACAIHGSRYTLYGSSRYVVCGGTCTDDAIT